MSNKRVRNLYETRLKNWAAARVPSLAVAHQNKPQTPVTGTAYLRAQLLPAKTGSEDLAGALRTYSGIFQVLVVAPINTGSGAAEAIGDELEALFLMNARLTTAGFTVQQITPATQAGAIQTATEYIVPVSFEYRADT